MTTLLVTAHQQARPLGTASIGDSLTNSTVWTSLTSGRDYNVRQDGDYLYVDWVSINAEVKAAGGFVRGELKKGPDGKWRGTNRSHLPCTYTKGLGVYARNVTNWCSREDDFEIDLLSDRRIEGISMGWQKFECKNCEAKGVERKPFTLIPK